MYKLTKRQATRTLTLTLLVLSLTGCPDPDKRADELFKKQGVNRVRKPNDFMQPGSVIIVKDKKAVYADNMLDYIESPPANEYKILTGAAVIPGASGETAMTADLALNFLDTFLPVKVSNKISLTSDVKLDMVNAKVKRMKVPDLQTFLNRAESQAFRNAMLDQMNQGKSVFIAYETYITNKVKLSANAGTDIAASATVGEIKPLFEGAEPKFTWVKKSKTSIDIDGDSFYVFGVKTAKLSFNRQTNRWSFDVTNFAPSGVLAAGTDDKFANAPTGTTPRDFQGIDIERRDPRDFLRP